MVQERKQQLRIYTKTGDKGKASLIDGRRVSKDHFLIEIYGEIDELNCAIGVATAQIKNEKLKMKNYSSKFKNELVEIQKDLFKVPSLLSPQKTKDKRPKTKDFDTRVEHFENLIDQLSGELSELKQFILPGGGEAGSFLHLARAVCRRLERRLVQLSKKRKIDDSILTYLNRLSDLLFVMARFVNDKERKKEICL